MKSFVLNKGSFPAIIWSLAVPAAITYFLWTTRSNEVTPVELLLSLGLIFVPWQTYLLWRRKGREELPLFSILASMYFLYYAIPLFWGDLTIADQRSPQNRVVSSEAITSALEMALLGVCALWLGMKAGFGRKFRPASIDLLQLRPSRLNYVRFVLVAGGLLSFSDNSTLALGQGGRQALIIIASMIPLLAFAILFRRYLRKEATTLDKALIAGFLAMRFLAGMSSGWLGVFTSILIICGSLYVADKKRVPRLALFVVVAFTLFFQVGKDDFRKAYWRGDEQPASRIERMTFWVDASLDKWNEVINHPGADTLRDALNPSVNRLSLLTQTANVIDQTPAVVPYQYGRLYSYMLVTFIPRFIWPDKPSVNDANQFYQIAYGLTREEDLNGVSIAVGVLTEGYISFGWVGAMGIMFLLGIFFDFYQHAFLSKQSGVILTALGIVLLPQFLTIEAQLAQYLGGIVQQVLLTLLVMLPAMSRRSSVPAKITQWQYADK